MAADLTKAQAQALVESAAWQAFAEVLLARYLTLAGYSITTDRDTRDALARAMVELRFVLQHPYRQAERAQDPITALEELSWFREWLGIAPRIGRDDWASFREWQAATALVEHPLVDDDARPRVMTERRSGPV